MAKEEDQVPKLEDIDPIFKKEIEEQKTAQRRKDEDLAKGRVPSAEPAKKVEVSDADRALYDLIGAFAGQGLARALDAGVRKLPEAAAAPMRSAGFGTAGMGPVRAPAAPVAPPAPMVAPAAAAGPIGGPAGPVGGPAGPASPTSPMGGRGSYNYGKAFGLTDIEAGRALDMSKNPGGANDLIRQRAEGLQRIQQMGGGFAENPRFGGLMTPEQSVGRGPRASFVQSPGGLTQIPPPQPVPTQAPAPGALTQISNAGKGIARSMAGSPFLTGALGGLSTAEGVQEYLKRQSEGDMMGQVLSGVGAAGGALAMAPHPIAKILGGGMAAVSPLSLYLYDKMRERLKNEPLKPRIPEPGTNFPPSEMLMQ